MKGLFLIGVVLVKSQPDLTLDEEAMRESIFIEEETYYENDCEINECLFHLKGGSFPISRKLLRFDTRAANIGNEPFRLGIPTPSNPAFVWDECHRHYHFENFAEYKVFTKSDFDLNIRIRNQVPETGKRAFCLMDSEQTSLYDGPRWLQPLTQQYDCDNQGISVGWQDIYGKNLDCQFVDVTDLVPGDYVLVVTLNPNLLLGEVDTSNNEASIPFKILPGGGQQIPINCIVDDEDWLGDGYCDGERYNTAECNYDFGDCCEDCCRDEDWECGVNGYNCMDPDCEVTDF